MKIGSAKDYLLGLPFSEETYPFGPDVMVFKIKGKMFATLAEDEAEGRMNLKCDPHEALMLRDLFKAVIPGYHMNKKHWNTVCLDGTIPQGEIERMIDNSFSLVVKSLPKKVSQHIPWEQKSA
ncbi:MmcQ/YjbR family DNA-binding protein [Aliiglaciecola sp. M165]|uniref:MmcQ/YjbR family DNA-binding protein n=1 Tax=Aliiglaciecola sp. M165 TaxID=2593649 RepID=UPI00117D96B2|nr:MmcQ/YjbR family DNA-binding protein [Aliiglaciecola sp. M165]TRY32391.1 MmcQ/YjbR family DNA-binding protein [Aliiglaciecola sp. M165]